MPSSAKPQQQPQLPAAAKLAELKPYFAFHPPTSQIPDLKHTSFWYILVKVLGTIVVVVLLLPLLVTRSKQSQLLVDD